MTASGASAASRKKIPDDCIIFDTETTGLEPSDHRIIEIGAVRFRDGRPTDEVFHAFINPTRAIDKEATAVHGISDADLADKPVFSQIADGFLAFVGDKPLVAHNAAFDARFIAAEMRRLQREPFSNDRYIDTLDIARRRYPGSHASLDALCKRLKIPLTGREKHSALVDAKLLAQVCVELNGGLQTSMMDLLVGQGADQRDVVVAIPARQGGRVVVRPTEAEAAAHAAFIAGLGETSLWAMMNARGR